MSNYKLLFILLLLIKSNKLHHLNILISLLNIYQLHLNKIIYLNINFIRLFLK